MATLLHIDSSPLASSVSRELTREFSSNWKAVHPDGRLLRRDLAANPPQAIDQAWIYSVFTPEEARTAEQTALLAYSDQSIDELVQADEVVIGVAMHNFSIPSVLKLWIDQIARKGRTFDYGAEGPKGLLTGKKATLLVATGGEYAAGTPMAGYNFIDPYLRTVLGFLGITDVTFVTAGGTSKLMTGNVDRGQFLQPHLEQVRSIAI